MAVLMMAHHNNNSSSSSKEGGKPIFIDFLGAMSCASDSPVLEVPKQRMGFGGEIRLSEASASVGASSGGGHGPVSATSDLGSERQTGNHFEGFPIHGLRSDYSGPEISNIFQGRKRSNSDSVFTASTRDRMPQIGLEPIESSHLMKILRGAEGPRKSHDEELLSGMQPPRLTAPSHIIQPPVGRRPDSVLSMWERSTVMNVGSTVQHPSRLGQFAMNVDNVASNRYRDGNASTSVISQAAADEGSRTGIKGSGILSAINASSGVSDKNSSGVLPSSRPKSGVQTADPESSNLSSRHGLTSASRQMTIFYAGQAHVFDDVHPNKADVIMALAGSNGGSWSTTYSPKSSVQPPLGETCAPNGENEVGISKLALPQELRGRLSMPGNSSHGFSQSLRNSTIQGDPLNMSIPGGLQGSTMVRDTRPPNQAAEPDAEGKREV